MSQCLSVDCRIPQESAASLACARDADRPVENRRFLLPRASSQGSVHSSQIRRGTHWLPKFAKRLPPPPLPRDFHVVFTKPVNETRLPSAAGWERRMEFDNALPWERTEIRVSPLLRYANLLNGINAPGSKVERVIFKRLNKAILK